MITGEDIEYLIWTYDLPEIKGRKIRDIVVKQHETIGFASYDELYQRISHLVERFSLEETNNVLNMAGIMKNSGGGYPADKVRKRIFNPSFGFALKHLDLW